MFQFPPSPTPNQTFTPVAGVTYRWSGTAWHLIAGPGAFLTAADADVRYVNIDEAQNTTNRIINGKFAIDQRNAGAAVTGNSFFPVDRWVIGSGGGGSITGQRDADNGEFRLRLGVGVADATLAATDNYNSYQPIEGYNLADLQWGTAQASPITIAFEVEATVFTGTLVLTCANGAINRSYPAPFTINAAGVRETKVITIPGDTTGTWPKDNAAGMYIVIALASGSNFSGTANTWQAGNIQTVPGAANFMANGSNQLRFKNFRLYKGSVDFGPDRRLYAEELALCQRYYEKSYQLDETPAPNRFGFISLSMPAGVAVANGSVVGNIRFTTRKRTGPTVTIRPFSTPTNTGRISLAGGSDLPPNSGGLSNVSDMGFLILNNSGAPITADFLGTFICHYEASAEL